MTYSRKSRGPWSNMLEKHLYSAEDLVLIDLLKDLRNSTDKQNFSLVLNHNLYFT